MSDKKISSLEKIGYLKVVPKDADMNGYESIIIKEKSGKTLTMYRLTKDSEDIDDTRNFNSSWDVFNSLL
tara:strand:+ start:316 stop:525 length:210 start_codon:yes stop_codon:yes gene_type:complete